MSIRFGTVELTEAMRTTGVFDGEPCVYMRTSNGVIHFPLRAAWNLLGEETYAKVFFGAGKWVEL